MHASLWVGGVLLVAAKAAVYVLSGSDLIRASMVESLGDVMNSSIMAFTQMRVADTEDEHLYPAGKRRFASVGILFVSACAISAMIGVAGSSLHQLFSSHEESGLNAFNNLLASRDDLREQLGSKTLDAIAADYAGQDHQEHHETHQIILAVFGMCVLVKVVCLCWCKFVESRANSAIARTLAMDHRNDAVSNLTIVSLMAFVTWMEARDLGGPLLDKVDPLASLVLSLWIAHGWAHAAFEQAHRLSSRSADPQEVEALSTAVQQGLKGSSMRLCSLTACHAGDGYEVRLELSAGCKGSSGHVEAIARELEFLEQVVHKANSNVGEIIIKLSPHASVKQDDDAWVSQYNRPPV